MANQEDKSDRLDKRSVVFTLESPEEERGQLMRDRPFSLPDVLFPENLRKTTRFRPSGSNELRKSSELGSGNVVNSPGTDCSSGIGVSPRSSDSLRYSTSSGVSLDDCERNVSDGSVSRLSSSSGSSSNDEHRGRKTSASDSLGASARLSWGSSSNEDVKGGKKVESSLMMHVKRRAKPEFMGFVDAVTLAPAKLPHNRGVRVASFLAIPSEGSGTEADESPLNDLRQHLEKPNTRFATASLQVLLTDTLPRLDYLRDMGAIADYLTAASPTIQKDALGRLERLILISKYSEMTEVTQQLFAVACKTRDVILSQTVYEDHILRMCGHVHLLATSALVRHKDRPPTADEWKTISSWPKTTKKQSLLKLMLVFYEHFEKRVKELKPASAAIRGDRKKFSRANFSEQFVAVFSVLNEIAEQEWTEPGLSLLGDLRELHEIVHKDGRLKPGHEPRIAFDLLLIRGLMVLLNTTYAKVRQQVGDGKFDHPKLASDLLLKLVNTVDPAQKENIQREVGNLLFHESPLVTEAINCLLPASLQSRLTFAFDYIENSLVVTGFHVDRPGNAQQEVESVVGSSCLWLTFRGRFGQTQRAEGAVYVHTVGCQAKGQHYECLHGSHGKLMIHQPHERCMDILSKLCFHKNLLRLLAYQHAPFPFYITEEVKDRRLLEQLLNHRAARNWLDTATLCLVALDIVAALEFLASRGIASRDVTAYDMTVFGRSRRGGTAGEVIEVLASSDFIIQLANLGLAHNYRSGDGELRTVPVSDQGPIPLLWTPREAFLHGEYSEKSMVYSLGAVLYELWTHGGQPFTAQSKSTNDTLRTMLLTPESVMLIHWPCIPDDVYQLIQNCTAADPDRRPSLPEVRDILENTRSNHLQRDDECFLETVGGKDQQYPSLFDDQIKRKYVPERGIPVEIQMLIDEYKKNKFDICRNPGERQEDTGINIVLTTESEFYSPEWLDVYYERDSTVVREKLSKKFLEDCFPALRKIADSQVGGQLSGITDWLKDPANQPQLEQVEFDDHVVHERRYPVSWVLQEMATKGLLVTNDDDGYVAMGPDRYVTIFISMARALHGLHERGWLHRDLRASNTLIDCNAGQAIFVRIGRMHQVTAASESAVEEVFEDTRRWLAPEVLQEGKYRRENDVFMLGTAFWETFNAREVTLRDPTATAINFVPFADHEKGEVVRLVRSGTPLPKPEGCPDWLYELILKCRHPDVSQRPTVTEILENLLRNVPAPSHLFTDSASEQAMFPPPALRTTYFPQGTSGNYPPELPKRHRAHKVILYVGDVTKKVLGSSGTLTLPRNRALNSSPALGSSSPEAKGSDKQRRPSLPNVLDPAKINPKFSDRCDYLTPTSDLGEMSPVSRSRSNTLPSSFSTRRRQPAIDPPFKLPKAAAGVRVKPDKTKVFTRVRSEGSGFPPTRVLHDAGRSRTQSDPPNLDAVREHEEEDHVYDFIRDEDAGVMPETGQTTATQDESSSQMSDENTVSSTPC